MSEQQRLNALAAFKTDFRPVPKYPKSPSKRLNERPFNNVETKPKSLFNFATASPGVNFQRPEQIQAVMSHLHGHDVLGGLVNSGSAMPFQRGAQNQRKNASVAETARILGCTKHRVDRLAKAYMQGGVEAVGQLRWRAGRPLKYHGYTQEELDVIVSKQGLKTQAGLSMKARAIRVSEEYGKSISAYQLRQIFKGRGVTTQKPQVRPGRPKFMPIHEQAAKIEDCKRRVMYYHSQGYEIITIDECIFSPKQVASATWAPVGDPLLHEMKYYPYPYIAVLGAASDMRGYIHSDYKVGAAFKKPDVFKFCKELHARTGGKFAIFLDNASIHAYNDDMDWYCKQNEIGLIFNCAYRPSFNGIEFIWAWCKREYRAKLNYFKAMYHEWDQLEVVKLITDAVPQELAIKCVRKGFQNLHDGEPVYEGGPTIGKRTFDVANILRTTADDEIPELSEGGSESSSEGPEQGTKRQKRGEEK